MPQPCSLNAAAGPQSVHSICTGQERSISALLAVNKLLTAAVKKKQQQSTRSNRCLKECSEIHGGQGLTPNLDVSFWDPGLTLHAR